MHRARLQLQPGMVKRLDAGKLLLNVHHFQQQGLAGGIFLFFRHRLYHHFPAYYSLAKSFKTIPATEVAGTV
jgi:hypothetical protein